MPDGFPENEIGHCMRTVVPLLCAALLASCGGGLEGVAPPSATPQPLILTHYTALGDSIIYGDYASDPQTQSYPAVLAGDLGVPLTDLGIPGGLFGISG